MRKGGRLESRDWLGLGSVPRSRRRQHAANGAPATGMGGWEAPYADDGTESRTRDAGTWRGEPLAARAILVIIIGGLAILPGPVEGAPVGKLWETSRRESTTAEASKRLEAAKRLEREAGRGPDATARLRDAARAYEAIANRFPHATVESSQALFRLGKLHWKLREPSHARTAFLRIVTVYPGERELVARSLLEVAHLDRREGDWKTALAGYERITREFAEERGTAADAGVWFAKCLIKLRRPEEARDWLQGFSRSFSDRPREALQGVDLLVQCWIELGDPVHARLALDEAIATFEERARRAERQAEDIRKALTHMTAPTRLAKYHARAGR